MGVRPRVNRFLVLLRFTILKMILWSTWTLSTEKLNQNLQRAFGRGCISPVSRVAGVRPDEEVVLIIIDKVHPAKVTCVKTR
jgi:hypothetical protein